MNREERLLKAFGDISDKYIEEAAPAEGADEQVISMAGVRARKVPWRAMSTVAACLVLALSIGIYRQNGIRTEYADSAQTQSAAEKTPESSISEEKEAAPSAVSEGAQAEAAAEETLAGNVTEQEETAEADSAALKPETATAETAAAGENTAEGAGAAAGADAAAAAETAAGSAWEADRNDLFGEMESAGSSSSGMDEASSQIAAAIVPPVPAETPVSQEQGFQNVPVEPTEQIAQAPEGPASDTAAADQQMAEGPAADINAPKVAGVSRPAAEAVGIKGELDIAQANPFLEFASPEEAAAVSGFSMTAPPVYGTYDNVIYRTIPGTMTEVIYTDDSGAEGLRIRKAAGTEDISGRYESYDYEHNVEFAGRDINLKGSGGTFQTAIWTDGTYSYAVCAPEDMGLTAEQALLIAGMTE